MAAHARERLQRWTVAALIALGLLALYLLAHPYDGIRHDAHYYALQALHRLDPAALDGDLYFRFGSQDSFTLFSPIYAALVRRLGLEPAALAVTRASGLALLAAALLLARRLMDRQRAWLALALFAVVAGSYGGSGLFAYGEDFATPRPIAEALTLASIATLLLGRRAVAAALLALAFALHPLMAAPGAVLAVALLVPVRRWPLLGLAGVVALGASLLVARFAPVGPLCLLDAQWRSILEWAPKYLLTYRWTLADWLPTAIPLATLGIAALLLPPGLPRHAALAALFVGAAGILLAVLGSHSGLVLLLQGQAWRWVWVSRALAVLLFLPLASELWKRGPLGRSALALTVMAWGTTNPLFAFPAGLLALLAAVLDRKWPPASSAPRALPWIFAALAVVAVAREDSLPTWALAVPLAALVWFIAFKLESLAVHLVAVLALAGAFGAQAVKAIPDPAAGYSQQRFDALAPWRERIRPDQTVLMVREPFVPWLLLHRPSYGAALPLIFSRDTAVATFERSQRLRAVGASQPWFEDASGTYREPPLTLAMLRRLCQEREVGPSGRERPAIDFVIAEEELPVPSVESPVPLPSLSGEDASRRARMRLYSCADANRAAAPSSP